MMAKAANVVIAIILFAVAAVAGFQYSDNRPPTTFLSQEVLTPMVAPGGLLDISYVVDRHSNDCRVVIGTLLIDGSGFRWTIPPETYAVLPGPVGRDRVREKVPVPTRAAPGSASLRTARAYWCNTIQKLLDKPIVVRQPDLAFAIRSPAPGRPGGRP